MNEPDIRQKIKEAHNLFHGRYDTHEEVAKHARWTPQELESVQIQDEELFYDDVIALITAECTRARIDELKHIEGDTAYSMMNGKPVYIDNRIKELESKS